MTHDSIRLYPRPTIYIVQAIKVKVNVPKMNGEQCKLVFADGDAIRVLRGVITHEDHHFITLTRRDGVVRVARSQVLKIDERKVQSEGVRHATV